MKTAHRNITGIKDTHRKNGRERGQIAGRKKSAENCRLSERQKAWFISVILAVLVMMPGLRCHTAWAAENESNVVKSYVTTRETGPITQHIPQIFTVDCATDEVRNVTNGGEGEFVCYGLNGTPILFRGILCGLFRNPDIIMPVRGITFREIILWVMGRHRHLHALMTERYMWR